LQLEDYKKVKVARFPISGDVTADASPDSTFAVTKKFLDAAVETVLIGI
jgi:hypothetical protein